MSTFVLEAYLKCARLVGIRDWRSGPAPQFPPPKFPSDKIPPRANLSSLTMLLHPFVLALLTSIAVAYEAGIPYLNSSGLVVNDVPYSTRVYWMKRANEALFNYSGPWYPFPPNRG